MSKRRADSASRAARARRLGCAHTAEDAPALEQRARADFEAGRIARGDRDDASAWWRSTPEDAEAHFLLGVMMLRTDRVAEAEARARARGRARAAQREDARGLRPRAARPEALERRRERARALALVRAGRAEHDRRARRALSPLRRPGQVRGALRAVRLAARAAQPASRSPRASSARSRPRATACASVRRRPRRRWRARARPEPSQRLAHAQQRNGSAAAVVHDAFARLVTTRAVERLARQRGHQLHAARTPRIAPPPRRARGSAAPRLCACDGDACTSRARAPHRAPGRAARRSRPGD